MMMEDPGLPIDPIDSVPTSKRRHLKILAIAVTSTIFLGVVVLAVVFPLKSNKLGVFSDENSLTKNSSDKTPSAAENPPSDNDGIFWTEENEENTFIPTWEPTTYQPSSLSNPMHDSSFWTNNAPHPTISPSASTPANPRYSNFPTLEQVVSKLYTLAPTGSTWTSNVDPVNLPISFNPTSKSPSLPAETTVFSWERDDDDLPPSSFSTTKPPTSSPSNRPTNHPITLSPTQSPSLNPTFKSPTEFPTHYPIVTIPPTIQPTAAPTAARKVTESPVMYHSNSYQAAESTNDSCHPFILNIQTDSYGEETSWKLFHVVSKNRKESIASVDVNTYNPFQEDSLRTCLKKGTYEFILMDTMGDGFCCGANGQGSYSISVDSKEIIRGGYYRSEISYTILIGYDPEPSMSERDKEWLNAHNVRRKDWHERHGHEFVPLVWSFQLAADASSWAEQLLNDCDIPGIRHESGVPEGENLAKNKGDTEFGMGKLYEADSILRRWVDNEEGLGYPKNAHLTQALWRASRYLGCGDSVREYEDGSICRVQVCRYVRAGNCAMGTFKATVGDNWLEPMLMEYTKCGPECPTEGCY